MAKIAGGESGGDYNARYGFPDLAGAPGPQGESHALGKYQFEPATWKQASQELVARGHPPPDFNNPGDQDRVAKYWATKTYGTDANGRNLVQAAQAGAVDYGRLAGQWPSLNPSGSHAASLADPMIADWQKDRASRRAQLDRISAETEKILQGVAASGGRDSDTMKALREAQQKAAEYQEKALELAANPPSANPRDMAQRFGGVATLLGILGGLLTRQPLTASLTAGAAAMTAYNNGDQEAYQRNYDAWKFHTDVMMKMASFQHQSLRDLLYDEHMDASEKTSKLQIMLSALGNERMAAMAGSGDMSRLIQEEIALDRAHQAAEKNQAQIQHWHDAADLKRELQPPEQKILADMDQAFFVKTGQHFTPEQEIEAVHQIRQQAGGRGGEFEASKTVQVLDKGGAVVRTFLARERKDSPGWVDSQSGEPIKLNEGQQIKEVSPGAPGAGGGGAKDQAFTIVDKDGNPVGHPFMAHRGPGGGYLSAEDNAPLSIGVDQRIMPFKQDTARLQQQQQRMIGAANTSEFYLHNISRLPITASRGWFMGVENHTPEGLTEAFKRNFARNLTDYDTKEMQASAAGLGRVFGMLETQGGLQGMQTYGTMIEAALTPQVNDPPLLTMRRMAEMRGIIERAAEAGKAQTKDPKVIALLDKVAEDARASVPYVMDDVSDLENSIRKHGGSPSGVVSSGHADESIREFSAKVLNNIGGSASQKLPEGVPQGSRLLGTKDGNPVYVAPDGSRYMVH